MKNPLNITIVLLAVAAAILGAVLIGSYTGDKAYAETMSKQGDYVMSTIQFSEARDLIVVLDIAARRMNAYTINTNSNTIDLIDDTVDLDRAFGE